MTEPPSRPETADKARAAEAAAIRRRWINIGEILAVAAVVISGLTLWLNWSERSDKHAEIAAQASKTRQRAASLTLRGTAAAEGRRLDLLPASIDQTAQAQRIVFPAALGTDPVETSGDPRIEARWFDDALKKVRENAGLPDDSRGDERLPLLIETRFLVDGKTYDDTAIYDVGYTVKGQMFGGHDLRLRGLSLARRINANGEKALESRWQRLHGPGSPRKKS